MTEGTQTEFHVLGLAANFTEEVRRTMRAPHYGHPVLPEVARGTGPCRACLQPFRVGEEERLLFTYRPAGEAGTVTAPGPVFIHAHDCEQYRGTTLPDALADFPLIVEARASDNQMPVARRTTGATAQLVMAELLSDPRVEYLHVRHGEAGCHIVRVDRGPLPVSAA